MIWNYDACGVYCIYKGYLIINQEHPKLDKYAIYKEAKDLSLVFQTTASTLIIAKEVIKKLIPMEELLKYAKEAIAKYPKLLKEIEGLVDLCKNEIEQGESATHEIELCMEDIRQLMEEQEL